MNTQCIQDISGPFDHDSCNSSCGPPGIGTLAPLQMIRLPLGSITPTGWLGRQLAIQLQGACAYINGLTTEILSQFLFCQNTHHESFYITFWCMSASLMSNAICTAHHGSQDSQATWAVFGAISSTARGSTRECDGKRRTLTGAGTFPTG